MDAPKGKYEKNETLSMPVRFWKYQEDGLALVIPEKMIGLEWWEGSMPMFVIRPSDLERR